MIPKVQLNHIPAVAAIPVESDRSLEAVSLARNLALNPNVERYTETVQLLVRHRRIILDNSEMYL